MVSRAYNHYGSLIKGAVKQQNRFLIWFLLRYTANTSNGIELLGLTKRRWWESEIFGLINNENMFSSCVNIFTQLNIGKFNQQILYNHITKYETKNMTAQNIKIFKSDATSRNFDMYFTFQYNLIQVTLQPYLTYLNNLTQKTFTLENIYCISNYCNISGADKTDNVAAINKILRERFNQNKQKNTKQDFKQDTQTNNHLKTTKDLNQTEYNQSKDLNTTQTKQDDLTSQTQELTQILILYPSPTLLPIQIIQPQNTFLTLVVAKNAKLDCAHLILNQCELYYLEYDENEKETQNNPRLTNLQTKEELTLEPKNENDYEVSKDNKLYFINKDKGILNLTLNNEKEKAIELYSFAKENEFKILKDKASQILNIKLKLKDKESIETSNKGNFNLEISNLLLLDSKGDDLNIRNDYKLYLHNCENRRIYKNTSIQKNTDNTYRVNFSFDLIQDENSLFFKKTTKLIVATQTLNDFSTKEIHSKANVAIISLSSKDKKERSYTFTPRVSAQEFKEEELKMRGEERGKYYIDEENKKDLMILEVVRKWEYRGDNDPNKWATMSQFKLLKNNIELLSGGIVEPAATNPNHKRKRYNLSPEQQQKTAGSDTRIPEGEYKVFWKYSTKQIYARSAIDLDFIELLKLNGICLKNDVRDFSINPHSINKGRNQEYDNNRKKTFTRQN